MKRLLVTAALTVVLPTVHAATTVATVYKSPDCGCCKAWVKYIRTAGFEVRVVDTTDMQSIKDRLGVPNAVRSCHTAVLSETNQIIEGHVPASALKKLLSKRAVHGVAAPGMPLNAPGMGEMNGGLVTVDFAGSKFSQD
ncbi:hypothetical protein BURK_004757 [Burkholderia sp. SJ98]|nr:hypothetical protein BURK_004757 [Burkholderia sp. SJ98]